MFSGCLSQIPMLNLLLKDMEICRGTKPFHRCQKASLSCFPDLDNGGVKKKNNRKRLSYICFKNLCYFESSNLLSFFGQISSLFLQFCQKYLWENRIGTKRPKDPIHLLKVWLVRKVHRSIQGQELKEVKNFMRRKRIHFLSSLPSTVNISTHSEMFVSFHILHCSGEVSGQTFPELCQFVPGFEAERRQLTALCQVGLIQLLSPRNAIGTHSAMKWL